MWEPRNFPPFLPLVSRQRLRFASTSRMPTVIWVGRKSIIATVVKTGSRTVISVRSYLSCQSFACDACVYLVRQAQAGDKYTLDTGSPHCSDTRPWTKGAKLAMAVKA